MDPATAWHGRPSCARAHLFERHPRFGIDSRGAGEYGARHAAMRGLGDLLRAARLDRPWEEAGAQACWGFPCHPRPRNT